VVGVPAPPNETDDVVEYEQRVSASPETVFQYFTDPARMVEWMGTDATLDPRPGGVCRINPTGHAVMSGQFLEVDPPHRLVFTWGWETKLHATPPQSTVVEVSLTPEGDETIVRLVHRSLQPGAVAFHRAGWAHYLPRLAKVASGNEPAPDPWRKLTVAIKQQRDAGVPPPGPRELASSIGQLIRLRLGAWVSRRRTHA
jgi:uncharacterized protein YndB with AHSA1/START domain